MEMMRNWTVLLLAFALTAGCVSASAPSFPAENQEEWVRKTLTGTWNGYIKSTRVIIIFTAPTLQIFRVNKIADNQWRIALSLNGKWINTAELTVNDAGIRIEFIELYGNLLIYHRLDLDNDRRLVGLIWYGIRTSTPAEVTFEKIY